MFECFIPYLAPDRPIPDDLLDFEDEEDSEETVVDGAYVLTIYEA